MLQRERIRPILPDGLHLWDEMETMPSNGDGLKSSGLPLFIMKAEAVKAQTRSPIKRGIAGERRSSQRWKLSRQ